MIYNIEIINVDPKFQEFCKLPYPNHPRGCPNYGKKKGCPPEQKLFFDIFDHDFYLIFTKFDLGAHVAKLKKKHSKWTQRQLECCLYWQGTARRNLKAEIALFKEDFPTYFVTACPEAMGVDVTDLMEDNAGIVLDWPPQDTVYQVAVAGLCYS